MVFTRCFRKIQWNILVIILISLNLSFLPGDVVNSRYELIDQDLFFTNIARYQDTYYLSTSSGLIVAHAGVDGHLELLGKVTQYPFSGHFLTVHDHFLIAQHLNHLNVFDLSAASNPILVNQINIENGYIRGEGEYLYIARYLSGMEIYYLGNLPHIHRVGQYGTQEPVTNFLTSFDVSQRICAGANLGWSLQFVDCNDPLSPTLIAACSAPPDSMWVGAMCFQYPFCFATLRDTENSTYELNCLKLNPDNSLETIFVYPVGQEICDFARIDPDELLAFEFSTDRSHRFRIVPGADPQPVSIWDVPFPARQHLGRSRWLSPYLFLLATGGWGGTFLPTQDGFQLIDVFSEAERAIHQKIVTSGQLVGTTYMDAGNFGHHSVLYRQEGDGYSRCWSAEDISLLALVGNVLYACVFDQTGYHPHLRVYDVSNPISPEVISDREDFPFYAMYVTGRTAVGLSFDIGVQVLDLTVPENPIEVCRWKPDQAFYFSYGVVDGNRLYVCDQESDSSSSNSKLWIVDISDLHSPVSLSEYAQFFNSSWCLPFGDTLYLADELWVWIVDVTDPSNPTIKRMLDLPPDVTVSFRYPHQVLRLGHYLISNWGGGGLWIWDLNFPEEDTPIGWMQFSDYCYDTMIVNNAIYVAAGHDVLIVQPEFFSNGDVNQDGTIDAADVMLMSYFFSERLTFQPNPVLFDVNRDSIVDITDLVALRRLCVE